LDLVLEHCPADSVDLKNLKKVIVKTLLESDTSKDIFNEDIILRITKNTTNCHLLVEDRAM